jgi:L-malate glycosyltransferase
LGETMRGEGVPVVALGRQPGFDIRVARRMAKEIADRGLEVVHAHQYTPFFYSALARLFVRRPMSIMFTEHGRHFPDTVSPRRRLINRFILSRLADDINGVCGFSARSLATVDGFGNREIEVIPNGIDMPRYRSAQSKASLRGRLGLRTDRRYIICVARFHRVKDHAMLLHAFAEVAASRPDVDLLLAGDGPLRSDLERMAGELGISARVRFLGVRDDVAALLQAADVFALTSVSEAASITLLEAMGSGLPVVVTNVGGNPEIVIDGEHGYLVARGDAGAAAQRLGELLDDEARAHAMGEAGRNRVRDEFQLDRTVSEYYRRYAAAAGMRRGAAA